MHTEQSNGLRQMFQEFHEATDAATQRQAPSTVIHSERVVVINAQSINIDAASINRMMDAVAG